MYLSLNSGFLHIEMNACKAFVKCNWEVFIKNIVMELGFTSQNALKYMYNCKDHHKTWRLCELILFSCTDEILQPYTDENGDECSVNGFWQWITSQNNQGKLSKNYVYVQEMTLDILIGIMLFRISIRRNNYDGKLFYHFTIKTFYNFRTFNYK